jgi:microcystin degradation protein MlrC
MSNAPVIFAEGVVSILEKVASSFGSCLDVSLTVGFDAFDERVVFTVNNADKPAAPDAEAAFMKILREHQHVLAERLADARALSRLSGEDVEVHVADLSDDPAWAALSLTARPTLPDDDDDEEDEFDD